MLNIICASILLLVVASFFISSLILWWLSKMFKVNNFTFRSSMKVILLYLIFAFVIAAFFSLVNLGILSEILSLIISFFIFYYLLKKYQAGWQKALGIYICLSIINVIIAVIIVVVIRSLVMQPFSVSGDAMVPSFNNHDYLFVNMMNKDFKQGDVVVFRYPTDPSKFFLKRIIGLPGDNIEIKDAKVFVNNKPFDEPYLSSGTETNQANNGFNSLTLKNGQYFLLGDNRDKSLDSRIFGPVDASLIVGKIWFELYPQFKEFK